LTKKSLARLWAIFSQTHLVILVDDPLGLSSSSALLFFLLVFFLSTILLNGMTGISLLLLRPLYSHWKAVLPDGIFSNQKYQFRSILEGLAMEVVCILIHFAYFTAKGYMAIWYILWSSGIFFQFWYVVPSKIWQPWSKGSFLKENNWFFVTDQTPRPTAAIYECLTKLNHTKLNH
jgi:hypothetical protein